MRKTFWKMMFGHHIDLAHHKPIYENFEVTSEIKFGIDLFENNYFGNFKFGVFLADGKMQNI